MKNLSSFLSLTAVLLLTLPARADICSEGRPTCAELGFNQTKSSCKGKFNACPFDLTKGICVDGPAVGDIKYSLKSANHDGWLLCNGTAYSTTTYSKLYGVIGTKFGSSGSNFRVPDYRGFFLRGYGSASNLSSYGGNANNSTTTPQKEQLPNITGYWNDTREHSGYQYPTGAFAEDSRWGDGSDGNEGFFAYVDFNASRTPGTGNGVYKDNGHVIPGNYAAYIFIYAGQ